MYVLLDTLFVSCLVHGLIIRRVVLVIHLIFVFFRLLPSRTPQRIFPYPLQLVLTSASSSSVPCPPSLSFLSPFGPSPFALSWQFHPQHHYHTIPIIFPPYMYKPPQSIIIVSRVLSPNRPTCAVPLGAVAGIRRKGLSDGLTLTRWRNAIFRVAGATN